MSVVIHFPQDLPIVAMALTIMGALILTGWLLAALVSRLSSAPIAKLTAPR